MKRLVLGLLVFILLLSFNGCGGNSTTSSSDNSENENIYSIIELNLFSLDKPLDAKSNIYRINFNGYSYIKFKTKKAGKFLYHNGGIEYSGKTELLDADGNDLDFKSGDYISSGTYILKIRNDTSLNRYKPFFTFISNSIESGYINKLELINDKKYETEAGFKAFFEINIEKNNCLGIQGSYQDIDLYDEDLYKTNYNLDNNMECDIPEGKYYLFYSNHTIYPGSFTIKNEAL